MIGVCYVVEMIRKNYYDKESNDPENFCCFPINTCDNCLAREDSEIEKMEEKVHGDNINDLYQPGAQDLENHNT